MAPTDYFAVPNYNQTAGFYEIFKFVGVTSTAGLFWPVMLMVTWVISFMALKGYSTSRAFTFASFFCSVLGIIMATLDFMAPRWMYLSIMLTLIGFVWLKLETETI